MTVWGVPYNDFFYELTRETQDIDFKKKTRVTKLKILIKMFRAGRSRNVARELTEYLTFNIPWSIKVR